MSETPSIIDCSVPCSPNRSVDPSCGCSTAKNPRKDKTAKYGARFVTLCAICCAVPPALIALGFISISTGAYLSAGSKVAFIVLVALGLGYLLIQYVKKKRKGMQS